MYDNCHLNVSLFARKLRFSISGEGPCVLLLHGYLESRLIWSGIAGELENYTVIVPELPVSDDYLLPEGEDMISFTADVVRTVAGNFGFEKCIVAGNSFGGYVALELSERYPEFVDKLILISTNPFSDSIDKKAYREREIYLANSGKVKHLLSLFLHNLKDDTIRKLYSEMVKKVRYENIVSAQRSMMARPDRSVQLEAAGDVLLIYGRNDDTIPLQALEEMIRSKGVSHCELPGNHFILAQRKEYILNCIKKFIENKPGN
ncbi:MAG: alpha/beta hydrolase [Chlorobi bacterium]|nr:alpha/beta hydrolase [Chlorobiota bacterium]